MKASWKPTTFADAPFLIIDGDRGPNYPKQSDYLEAGYCLFLNTGNVTKSGFDFGTVQFLDQAKDSRLRKGKLIRDDIVMTTRGTIGNVAHYNTDVSFDCMRINSGMVIFRCDKNLMSAQFLYHFLRSPSFLGQANSLRSGAAQPQLPIRDIKQIEIPVPPIGEQLRIATVITAYDDLIENNRRRMVLLEESARLLYREWFVRLRFPGHEHTRIVNGVPEGWKRSYLAELCETIDYGYTASADQEEIGPKFLRITDIVPNVLDWSSVPFCPIEDNRLEKFRLREGDIVIARTGATVGYAKRMNKLHPEAVFASYLVRLRLRAEVENLLVGIFVESDDYKSFVRSRVGGAAQPNASAPVLAAAELLVPTPRVQHDFREFVEPMVDELELLQIQNQKLRTARDLLLPKLMSGEIEV